MLYLNQLLTQIRNVAPNSQCVSFLLGRIQGDTYRQVHISQHNRYTQYEITVILQKIREIVGNGFMQIRTTDLTKRPINVAGEELYAQLTNTINLQLGRCTQDSLRKNFFVDMHRMGFLYRYDEHRNLIPPFYKAHTIKYVSLTPMAIDFLDGDSQTKNFIYESALMMLGHQFFMDLYEVVSNLGNCISQDEFMLFGTFLNQSFDDGIIVWRRNKIIGLIQDFRTLTQNQQDKLICCIQDYCNTNNFSGNKTNKRDFHNWLNETQQILRLLSQIPNFQVNSNNLYTN